MAEKKFSFPCDCGIEHILTRGEKGEIVHQKVPKKPIEKEGDNGEEKKEKKGKSEFDSFFDGLDS